MMATLWLVLVALVTVGYAESRADPRPSLFFSYKDCGRGPDMAVKVYSVSIKPDPIRFPGSISLSFDIDVRKTVTNADLQLEIKKKLIIGSVKVPCVAGFGSCVYTNMCQYLDLFPDPKPVTCPVTPQRITYKDITFDVPDLGDFGGVVSGRFLISGKFLDPTTKVMLACLEMDVKIAA